MQLRKIEKQLLLRIELRRTGEVLLDRNRGVIELLSQDKKKFPQI